MDEKNINTIVISINNLHKKYGQGSNKVEALKGVNLQIAKGEMIAIIGASGSGKSTLLNILGTLDSPTDGTYKLNNIDLSKLSNKQKANLRNETIGFVVQDFALIEKYTVRQNVELPLTYNKKRISKSERNKTISDILDKLGIENKVDTLVYNLSGGQRQRVAIGRALINKPDIILADEPTGALDSKTTIEIMEILKNLNQQGHTIIVVTHNPKVAEYCNTIYSMSDGLLNRVCEENSVTN